MSVLTGMPFWLPCDASMELSSRLKALWPWVIMEPFPMLYELPKDSPIWCIAKACFTSLRTLDGRL